MYNYLTAHFGHNLSYALTITIGILAALVFSGIIKCILTKIFTRKAGPWSAIIAGNKVFSRISYLSMPIVLGLVASDIYRHHNFWQRLNMTALVVIAILLADAIIRSAGDIYKTYEVSKSIPMGGLQQVLEIAVFVVGGIVIISIFVNQNPLTLLGGLGAMTAIITIVFKDAILGFVAGIQLTANHMIQVGDVIEIPQQDIAGTVTDISLVTVKLLGFDKTTIAVPAYTFVSEPFVNRRTMAEAGARRIMRSFHIDAHMVRPIGQVDAPGKYLAAFPNQSATNLAAFRHYVTEYLQSRPDIHQDETLLVRQLTPTDAGIPMEVFAFATATDLIPFEAIQSDVFDHIYGVLGEFGLRLYQRR